MIRIPLRPWRLAAACLLLGAAGPGHAAGEAPVLAARVAAGQLPPLPQRLPVQPEVIRPQEAGGRYGGTLRSALLPTGDENGILRFVGQGLTRWDPKFDHVIPNIAESWTVNPAATEYVFTLRRGMRWSDGAPFTADDVVFAVNDVLANRDLFRSVADRYQAGGEIMRAERLADDKVRIRFAAGNRLLPEELAGPYGHHPVFYPKHYCGRFHAQINPNAAQEAQQAGFPNWQSWFHTRCAENPRRWNNPERPTLEPWVISEPYAGNPQRVVLQRNPYFWQVDDQGRQLPYLDSVEFDIQKDAAAVLAAAAQGRFDLQIRHVNSVAARARLKPLVDAGSHAFMSLPDVNASAVGLYLNHTTRRLPLRLLFASVRFKSALSLAIDRQAIAREVFLGEAQPWQVGPPAGHRLHNAKLATQFTRLDLTEANRLLDEQGLTKRDEQGYRVIQGSGRLALRAIVNDYSSQMIDSLKLIRDTWKQVGVELLIEPATRDEVAARARSGDYDIGVDVVAGGLDPTQNPRAYLAQHGADSRQGLPWVWWYDSQGRSGEEPPPSMKQRLDLWDQWKAAPSEAAADKLFAQILAIAADELEVLGTVTPPAQTALRSTRLHGVPPTMPGAWMWPTPGPSLPQQYFVVD